MLACPSEQECLNPGPGAALNAETGDKNPGRSDGIGNDSLAAAAPDSGFHIWRDHVNWLRDSNPEPSLLLTPDC